MSALNQRAATSATGQRWIGSSRRPGSGHPAASQRFGRGGQQCRPLRDV